MPQLFFLYVPVPNFFCKILRKVQTCCWYTREKCCTMLHASNHPFFTKKSIFGENLWFSKNFFVVKCSEFNSTSMKIDENNIHPLLEKIEISTKLNLSMDHGGPLFYRFEVTLSRILYEIRISIIATDEVQQDSTE